MSTGLLGMDVDASLALAARLDSWAEQTEAIRGVIVEAELLADLPTNALSLVDEIGSDGGVMASAIRRAADLLMSFSVAIESPLGIASAVAAVHRFDGPDNDPELDRRLGALRTMVRAATHSDADAAQIMSWLLSGQRPVHAASIDVGDVTSAMAVIRDINAAVASGAMSANDPRIDGAVSALRGALSEHAASEAQLDALVATFLADRGASSASTLVASTVADVSPGVAEFAHANNLDYDTASGYLTMQHVDGLTRAMESAPLPEIEAMREQRQALVAMLAGTDDAHVVDPVTTLLDTGMSSIDAFATVMAHQERAARVAVIAEGFGLELGAAEDLFDELTADSNSLVAQGFDASDAVSAVVHGAHAGIDVALIESIATDEGLPLVEATALLTEAQMFGMTPDEYTAFMGLQEHFDVFDTARGGDPDGIVSIFDLAVVAKDPQRFGPESAAAAAAIIAAPGLRNRLDSATTERDVIGHDPFGADRPADHKYSQADTAAFMAKQLTNHTLRNVVDLIDVTGAGGEVSAPDTKLLEANFEAVLAQAESLQLSPQEIKAVELVLEHDWYDPTFWQEHGDSAILAAAVVGGGLLFVATGGLSTALSAVLISTAAATAGGAFIGTTLTLAENALTGDPLHEDLVANTLLGATGGLAGAGLAAGLHGLNSSSLAVRAVSRLSIVADGAGLVAAGVADPMLGPLMHDIDIAETKRHAQIVNYVGGALAVAGAAGAAQAANRNAQTFGDSIYGPSPPTNATDLSGEFDELLDVAVARSDDMIAGSVQRPASATLDALGVMASEPQPSPEVADGGG